ncbi:sensor histidine kinase [Sphingobacterium spiritivorum]|uniref:sensor histidine kinase n=2 Tax=Sphingobacterium TaxID=28453 RepID=UPI003DA4EE3B
MINKVHELSKSNSVALDLEIIDPRNKIITIAESSKDQYNVGNLEFVMGEILPVRGERTLLYQLFLNILGNAIKYSSKEDNPKVEVYSIKSGSKVIYFISDNGIGMDLKEGNNIFEIFQRLPNSSGYDGSGIGLSIVKRIIDRLGAEIKVESQLGIGTQFQIHFNLT